MGKPGAPAYVSGSRIKARIHTTTDGARGFAGWHDSELGVDCVPGIANDGRRRCLPVAQASIGSLFADDQCQQPVALALGAGCPLTPSPVYASEFTVCGGQGGVLYREVGKIHGGPVYRVGSSGCEQATLPERHIAYTVGEIVPPVTFAEMGELLE